ncbi:hypothetical protein WA026_015794 [Henosepilachna vigintioctopunctata]|uniref:Reverse transcriptase n=1 Tax=Henosepilachna vigintioctopunctata TaxID=420089 RepID=A0AAW1UTW9_9CUCU
MPQTVLDAIKIGSTSEQNSDNEGNEQTFYDQDMFSSDDSTEEESEDSEYNCGTGTRKKLPDVLTDDDDNKFQNMFDKANAFNNYFIDSIKNLTEKCEKINPTISHVRDYHSMYLFGVDYEEVNRILLSVSNKKSAGADEIPCTLIKGIYEFIVAPLTYLINIFFFMATFHLN